MIKDKKQAQEAKINALVELGNEYRISKNYNKAIKYYIKAAKKGNIYAFELLKQMLNEKLGVFKNQKKAERIIEKVRKKLLGKIIDLAEDYSYSESEENFKKMLELLEFAITQESYEAILKLTELKNIFLDKKSKRYDEKKGLECYELIIRNRMKYKGKMNLKFVKGMFLETNNHIEEAIACYKQAVEEGDITAANKLAAIYSKQENAKEELKYLKIVADSGDKIAIVAYGTACLWYSRYKETSTESIEYVKEALKYYKKILKDNYEIENLSENPEENDSYKEGIYSKLAQIYESGRGGKRDCEEALKYYNKLGDKCDTHKRLNSILLALSINKNQKIDYKELFELLRNEYPVSYIIELEKMINDNAEIITINNINEITLEELNSKPKNTIIYVNDYFDEHNYLNFYTIENFKKIIQKCNEILSNIDLKQSEENIFMQIYIKLALSIKVDTKVTTLEGKKIENDRMFESQNLMGLLSGKSVCAGYSRILKNLLNMVGIECIVENSRFELHTFNQVKIGDIWYYCDIVNDTFQIRWGKISQCLKSEEDFIHKSGLPMEMHIPTTETYESKQTYRKLNALFEKNLCILAKKGIKEVQEAFIEICVGKKDYLQAFKYSKELADNKNIYGLLMTAMLYAVGAGVKIDKERAEFYLEQAQHQMPKMEIQEESQLMIDYYRKMIVQIKETIGTSTSSYNSTVAPRKK